MIKEAVYYEKLEGKKVRCYLCPAECLLSPDKHGICRSRFNSDGRLITDNYGELVTLAIDPVEKKPLYHYYPGSTILSTGPNSCNLGCMHCQNWTISQQESKTSYLSPEQLVEAALESKSVGVAFTYTEPLMWFEYLVDVAPLLRASGLKTILVSNGYINQEPLQQLLPHIDAINVDLKSMRPRFYKRICKGKLEPVLESIRVLNDSNVHLEITNLVIPDENDSDEELRELFEFVANLSADIPLHLSAYHPDYRLENRPTPVKTLFHAFQMAKEHLRYVYIGNMMAEYGRDTVCPECKESLIARDGYNVTLMNADLSSCPGCGRETGICC